MRQNIAYWTSYTCLRPNRKQKLISYFYYVKYVVTENRIFFRHINMNVEKYLETEHGANIIQESVSFDDETEDDCTIIVFDFHRNIKIWWERVQARKNLSNTHIHDLEHFWTDENSDFFENFVLVSCDKSVARIIMSKLMHESIKHKDEKKRRIVLS